MKYLLLVKQVMPSGQTESHWEAFNELRYAKSFLASKKAASADQESTRNSLGRAYGPILVESVLLKVEEVDER